MSGLGGGGKAIALRVELPGVFGTNEPKAGWVQVIYDLAGCAIDVVGVGDFGELFQVFLFESAALGLHFAKLFEGLEESAGEALFVN
jgi:hypothetical protein